MSVLGNIANMAMANYLMNAQYNIGDFIQAGFSWLPQQLDPTQGGRTLLSWVPQLFKISILSTMGMKDFPKIMPMESMSQQSKPSELRYTDATSWLAKFLGDTGLAKKLDLSPIKIDYLIQGYLGRTTKLFSGVSGAYDPTSVVTRDYYFESGRTLSNYYNIKTENDQDYHALNKKLQKYTSNEKNRIEKIHDKVSEIEGFLTDFRDINEVKNPKRAAYLRDRIIAHIRELKRY